MARSITARLMKIHPTPRTERRKRRRTSCNPSRSQMGQSRTAWMTSLTTRRRILIAIFPSVTRQSLRRDGVQRRVNGILGGEKGRTGGPLDADIWVVPEQTPLRLRRVEVRALIRQEGSLTRHTEAVGESFGDVKLPSVTAGEDDPDPLSEGGGAEANVHRDVEHFSL